MWILPKQLHTLASVQGTEGLNLDLNESSQLCAQSLFVRSKPSPLRTWLPKWKRDSWTQHLFGRILKPSLGKAFEIEWTSLLAVTPVNLSVQQESEPEKTTQDTCGHGLQMELLQCDQNYVSLKTSKDIFRWGCPTLSKTWQEWVIERRGAYSARLNAVRRTNASECSLWPTIRVRQGQDCASERRRNSPSLDSIVKQQLECGPPAPDSHSTHGSRQESWGTPTARDHKSGRGKEDRDYKELTPMVERTQAGKLNPRWVDALLGLPIGWTMPSCTSPVTIAQTSCGSSETE
jgi:hypothetical protein